MLASRGWPRNKFTEIVTTSRVGRVNYHSRNCNARTRPSFEDLRAEQAERRMGAGEPPQTLSDRSGVHGGVGECNTLGVSMA